MRVLLLLTDDNFVAEVLGSYFRRDAIEVVRVRSAVEAATQRAGAIVVDLAKRGLTGDDVIALSHRAAQRKVPLLLLTAQPRRDVADFANVIRAADIVSKTEPMTATAARLRLYIGETDEDSGFAIPALAVASA